MQNYQRIYDYIYEFWKEIYEIYSKHAVAFLVTYYNINVNTTIWDNEYMMGGYYEKIGHLSGVKWNKYLLLPVYFVEETSTEYDGQDIGLVNEGNWSLVIPDIYGITPYANDMVKADQTFLASPGHDNYAIYCISGVSKQSASDKVYWKLKVSVEQSRTTDELDRQLSDTFVFYEYDKKIHTIPESQTMTRMLSKTDVLRENLKNLYDENSGLYLI
jgi:hypothetical protein